MEKYFEEKEENYSWIPFYQELAEKLYQYKNHKKELFEIIKGLREKHDFFNYLNFENKEWWGPRNYTIDPFSIFAVMNRNITDANRVKIGKIYKESFGLDARVPTDFRGIPILNNQRSIFGDTSDHPIWELFGQALQYAKTKKISEKLISSYEASRQIKGNGMAMLTIALYWIRPNIFMPLDKNSREYIDSKYKIEVPTSNNDQTTYFKFLNELGKLSKDVPFYRISYDAWLYAENKTKVPRPDLVDDNQALQEYTKKEFLDEVYMSEDDYDTICNLLKEKKNLILQGAPGVGKTFAARRLAYSIMGEKDDSRIEFIQFHQNYSYEDFVMGYQPDDDGFSLKEGLFVKFCEKIRADEEKKDYFLIIDEINRGNISKILGELLMAIEKDYREIDVKMAYNGMPFSVPENLYIIGMMNTADRSLALIDYALRRRFSFYEMTPGFQTNGFKKYQESLENESFNQIIERIEGLNIEIKQDPALGEGFQIGHSYFTNKKKETYTDAWLKRVIQYEIIPMLKEYWFDDEENVKENKRKLMSVFDNES